MFVESFIKRDKTRCKKVFIFSALQNPNMFANRVNKFINLVQSSDQEKIL